MENLKIRIDCTKEHLEKAKYCELLQRANFEKFNKDPLSNCWVALACSDIFPYCIVNGLKIVSKNRTWEIRLPSYVSDEIANFDLCKSIEEREALKPFSFEIEIDPDTLDKILEENGFSLKELEAIIENSDNLERVY